MRQLAVGLVFTTSTVAVLLGCLAREEVLQASPEASPDAEPGPAEERPGPPDGEAPTEACSPLDLAGAPVVEPRQVEGTAPTLEGGPLTPGRYVLVDEIRYYAASPPGASRSILPRQEVFDFDGGALRYRLHRVTDGGRDQVGLGSYAVDGGMLVSRYACPAFDAPPEPYASDGGALVLRADGEVQNFGLDDAGTAFVDAGRFPFTAVRTYARR